MKEVALQHACDVLKIIEQMMLFRRSKRENRVIDHDREDSMKVKEREGYS
jgi:hypothetical protein